MTYKQLLMREQREWSNGEYAGKQCIVVEGEFDASK